MNKIYATSCVAIIAAGAGALALCAPGAARSTSAPETPSPVPVSITIAPGARQTFRGFGASLGNWGGAYQKLPASDRAQLSRSLWHDLKFNTLRLWFNTDKFAPTRGGARDLSEFRRCYIDSGIVADAQKYGVRTLLLAPDGVPSYMAEKRSDGSGSDQTQMALKDGETENYAVLVATFIAQLKRDTGVSLNVTGVQNEPNNLERFSPSQIVRVVKKLRSELDARGLASVKIIAPEAGSVDGVFYDTVDALKADPVAWSALAGVASHSYNMSSTPVIAGKIAGAGKEYWQTEASDNGPEAPNDAVRAASLASRFLNDMNHRTTHWIHFLGFEEADPNDNATRIYAYTVKPFTLMRFQKAAYYQQLAETFDAGAIFRASASDTDGDMTYTYGKKPRITAAAARNPDGSWGIGLSNFTAPTFSDERGGEGDFDKRNSGYAAQTFTVTVRAPELADIPAVRFAVRRSNGSVSNALVGEVVMKKGIVVVPAVQPLDLVTLRSSAKAALGRAVFTRGAGKARRVAEP